MEEMLKTISYSPQCWENVSKVVFGQPEEKMEKSLSANRGSLQTQKTRAHHFAFSCLVGKEEKNGR